jgi:hypothetical protein
LLFGDEADPVVPRRACRYASGPSRQWKQSVAIAAGRPMMTQF